MKTFSQYLTEKVSRGDLKQVEKLADKLFSKFDIDVEFTKHFADRVNDKRNNPPITTKELMDFFKKAFHRYGDQISKLPAPEQAVLNDLQKDLNLPFVYKWDGKDFQFELVAKTIMRKKDFHTPNQKMRF